MITQRLVEIHGLQDRRIKAGEQLGGDNQDLQRVVGVAKAVEQLFFTVPIPFIGCIALVVAFLAGDRDHDVGDDFGRQVFIQFGFVAQTAFLVIGDDHGLETVGAHLFLKVAGNVSADGRHPFRHLHQHSHAGSRTGKRLFVEISQAAGEFGIGGVNGGFVDVEFHQARLKAQGERRAVPDRFIEAVAAQIAAGIFNGAKGGKGVAVTAIDGRAGKAKEKGMGQGSAHPQTQIAFLSAVCFIGKDDDVLTRVEQPFHLAKFVNGGDDDFAGILQEQLRQPFTRFRLHQIGNIGGVKGGADLGVQVNAIYGDDDGGVFEIPLHPQLLGGKDHEQRFARALKMPDQPLFGVARQHALHNLVAGVILLVTADDFDAPLLPVGGKEGEIGEHIEQHARPQQGGHRLFDIG